MLKDPSLGDKVEKAAEKASPEVKVSEAVDQELMMAGKPEKIKGINKAGRNQIQTTTGNNTMLAQVVGVIIGSPEFQRR